jgi:hypothetical protein
MFLVAAIGFSCAALAPKASLAQQASSGPETKVLMANASPHAAVEPITKIRTVSSDSTVWLAPTGHRQPHRADVPGATSVDPYFAKEDALVDRKISGICHGC